MKSRAGVLLFLMTFSLIAKAELADIRHQLFVFTKNTNPENLLVISGRTDSHCQLVEDADHNGTPEIDFNWLMNGTTYKDVNPLIRKGIEQHLSFAAAPVPNAAYIEVSDLQGLKTDIQDIRILIRSDISNTQVCELAAYLTLGPSEHNTQIRLQSIHAETESSVFHPFSPKILSVTFTGVDISDPQHRTISHKYIQD